MRGRLTVDSAREISAEKSTALHTLWAGNLNI